MLGRSTNHRKLLVDKSAGSLQYLIEKSRLPKNYCCGIAIVVKILIVLMQEWNNLRHVETAKISRSEQEAPRYSLKCISVR